MEAKQHLEVSNGRFHEIHAGVAPAFHAVANLAEILKAAGHPGAGGATALAASRGGKYYVTRNGSALIAFRLPEGKPDHFQLVASHADSPAFKLKPNPKREAQGYALMNVEKYGGMIMSTWFDRPLSVAGRLASADARRRGPGGSIWTGTWP